MRNYLDRSALHADGFEGRTLDLIADAFMLQDTARGRSPLAGTAALMSDDR